MLTVIFYTFIYPVQYGNPLIYLKLYFQNNEKYSFLIVTVFSLKKQFLTKV